MYKLPHVYLAAGWFNPEQKKQMDEIYSVLKDLYYEAEIEVFSPFYNGIVLKGKSDPNWRKQMKEVWDLDIQKLSISELVIVSTQDHDVGTIFESGYASAKRIPILCYNSNPELGLNVMLAQEARGFCKSPEQLHKAICAFLREWKEDRAKCLSEWRFNLWMGEPI